jgi:hypothetical protein
VKNFHTKVSLDTKKPKNNSLKSTPLKKVQRWQVMKVQKMPLFPKMDEITDKGAEAAFGEGEEAGEEAAEEAMDVGPMVEMLGMSEDRAKELMAAAQEIPRFAEMSAEDLAKAITEDFQVLMELERVAAMKTTGDMPEEAAEAAPMEPAPEMA